MLSTPNPKSSNAKKSTPRATWASTTTTTVPSANSRSTTPSRTSSSNQLSTQQRQRPNQQQQQQQPVRVPSSSPPQQGELILDSAQQTYNHHSTGVVIPPLKHHHSNKATTPRAYNNVLTPRSANTNLSTSSTAHTMDETASSSSLARLKPITAAAGGNKLPQSNGNVIDQYEEGEGDSLIMHSTIQDMPNNPKTASDSKEGGAAVVQSNIHNAALVGITKESVQFLFEEFYQFQKGKQQQNQQKGVGEGSDEDDEEGSDSEGAAAAAAAVNFPTERIPQLLHDYHQCHREVQLLRKAVAVSNRIFSFLTAPSTATSSQSSTPPSSSRGSARKTPPRASTRSPSAAGMPHDDDSDTWAMVHQRQSEEYIARLIVLEKSVYVLERQLQEQNRFHQAQREHFQQSLIEEKRRQHENGSSSVMAVASTPQSSSNLTSSFASSSTGAAAVEGNNVSSLESYMRSASSNIWFRQAMDMAERRGRQHGAEDLHDAQRKLSLVQNALGHTEELLRLSQDDVARLSEELENANSLLERQAVEREEQQQQQQDASREDSQYPQLSSSSTATIMPPLLWETMHQEIVLMRRQLSEVLDARRSSSLLLGPSLQPQQPQQQSSLITPLQSMARHEEGGPSSPSPHRPHQLRHGGTAPQPSGIEENPLLPDPTVVGVGQFDVSLGAMTSHTTAMDTSSTMGDPHHILRDGEPVFAATSGAIALAVGVVAAMSFLNRSMSR